MTPHHKIFAIVAAAGTGMRMKSSLPKQYLPLAGRRVIDHSLCALCESEVVAGVTVGIAAGDSQWRDTPFVHAKLCAVTAGGSSRAATVLNALTHLADAGIAADDDWAMVHDAARPCLCDDDITRLAAAARANGDGAILAVKLTDTLKSADQNEAISHTITAPENANYWRAMTPQMFRCGALKSALEAALAAGDAPSDEAAAMELVGVKPRAVEGHPSNLKITVPNDLHLAECYLRGQK